MKKISKVVVIVVLVILIFSLFYYQFGIDHSANGKAITISGPPHQNSTGNSTINHNKSNNTTVPEPQSIKVVGTSSNPYNYTSLKYGAIGTDLWNLKQANGSTNMTYNGKYLYVNSSLCSVKSDYDTILGYPEVAYGYNLEDQMFGSNQDGNLVFPMKFSKFKDLDFLATANFSFLRLYPGNIPIDFSYDLWLEQNPSVGHEPTSNDLEVMIWMYYQDNQPIGNKVGTFNTYTTINGHLTNSTWEIWYGSANAWPTVSFILQNPSPVSYSNITLNISKFILEGGNISGENVSNHTLMGIEMGNEFGNESIARNISDWILYYYSFQVGENTIKVI